MLRYKEIIRPPFLILLKNYLLYFAVPCVVLLPVLVKEVMKISPHMPSNTGGILDMYIRCYTSPFLIFIFIVLVFLAFVAYSNSIVKILVKDDRLVLPIQTGEHNAGRVSTMIPFRDIVSFRMKAHDANPLGGKSIPGVQELESETPFSHAKEYKIKCYKGFRGDWAVVEFSRPRRGIFHVLASLTGNEYSAEMEFVRIEFPTEKFEEIYSIIGCGQGGSRQLNLIA